MGGYKEDAGKGIISDIDIQQADALITNVRGIGLVTNYADCVPIFYWIRFRKQLRWCMQAGEELCFRSVGKPFKRWLKILIRIQSIALQRSDHR